MTRFSDPDVHQCPQCSTYLLWPNLMSFNTFGENTTWSDGQGMWSGMLDACSARCCPACRTVLWKDDLDVVGILTRKPYPVGKVTRTLARWFGDKHGHLRDEDAWRALPEGWKTANAAEQLAYPDLHRALLATPDPGVERELFLRRLMWWETNDHLRHRADGTLVAAAPVAPEEQRRANMLRMVALYEQAGNAVVTRAELLRQLGRFDEAVALLVAGAPEIQASADAAWILRWAKAADAGVKTCAQMPTGDPAPTTAF